MGALSVVASALGLTSCDSLTQESIDLRKAFCENANLCSASIDVAPRAIAITIKKADTNQTETYTLCREQADGCEDSYVLSHDETEQTITIMPQAGLPLGSMTPTGGISLGNNIAMETETIKKRITDREIKGPAIDEEPGSRARELRKIWRAYQQKKEPK